MSVNREKGTMRRKIRENIKTAYSLHDMNVMAFEVSGDDLVMRTQSGMVKVLHPSSQVDGSVEFQDVQWDFCYVYLLGVDGNTGSFAGEKLFLRDFIDRYKSFGFSIMDETYGYNMTKYNGYLLTGGRHCECIVEIYHEGDMVFVDESEYAGMKEVILSHDSEAMLCLVPAEVADNLEEYCLDFAFSWVWNGPENGKFLKRVNDHLVGAAFGASEFIDYLNRWAFPACESKILCGLGCYDYEIPEEYRDRPRHNF